MATDAWSDTVVQEMQLAVSPQEIHMPFVGLSLFIPGGVTIQGSHYTSSVYICFYTPLFENMLGNSVVQVLCWKIHSIYVSTVNNSLQRIRGMQFQRYSSMGDAGWRVLHRTPWPKEVNVLGLGVWRLDYLWKGSIWNICWVSVLPFVVEPTSSHQWKGLTLVLTCSSLKTLFGSAQMTKPGRHCRRSHSEVLAVSGIQLHFLPFSRKNNGGRLWSSGCFLAFCRHSKRFIMRCFSNSVQSHFQKKLGLLAFIFLQKADEN